MKAGSNGSAFISFHPLMVDIKTHLSSRPYMCWQLTERGALPAFEREGALETTDGISLTISKPPVLGNQAAGARENMWAANRGGQNVTAWRTLRQAQGKPGHYARNITTIEYEASPLIYGDYDIPEVWISFICHNPSVFRPPKIFQYDPHTLHWYKHPLPIIPCFQSCFRLQACASCKKVYLDSVH
jgi:hypothetical protein